MKEIKPKILIRLKQFLCFHKYIRGTSRVKMYDSETNIWVYSNNCCMCGKPKEVFGDLNYIDKWRKKYEKN